MTLDPSAPEQEPKVTKLMVDTWIKEALGSFKSTLENERRDREREQEHEKHQLWMQRNERYMGIMIGVVIGFVGTMILFALAQHLH
jgi:tetrahydromethanopterin S-methyltransferase subunit G